MGYLEEKGIKAVCFDIDGTFYPLKETNMRVMRASLPHLPFALRYNKARQRVRTEDSFLDLEPLDRKARAERMTEYMYGTKDPLEVGLFLEKEEQVFTRKYEKYFGNVKAYPGVKETLEALKTGGYRLGALSDFPIGSKLRAMGIEKYFDTILSSEDIGRYKPCLTPFRLLSERLGVEPGSILYVGDSARKDVAGAKRSGMHSVLLSKETNPEADLVVADWIEMKKRLF